MRKTKLYCDICDEEISEEKNNEGYRYQIKRTHHFFVLANFKDGTVKVDMCRKCQRELMKMAKIEEQFDDK